MNFPPAVDVILIGYEDQNNLGLRSIAAMCKARGLNVLLLSLSHHGSQEVLDAVRHTHPKLVGFSIIFQYALDDFGRLMCFLRENGVNQHFTAGGHFPSLRPVEILQEIPQLDSIVRFEGEFTVLELLQNLDQPETWERIPGLAFRKGEEVVCTPPRPLIDNLDSLPPIDYGSPRIIGKDLKSLPVLASRGCLFNCSFCSIRQFYGGAPGALRRTRSPKHFVDELSRLYHQQDIRVFIFQDDDFAARTPAQRRWLGDFLNALDDAGLTSQIAWKISCRVDDLDAQVLADCKARGLSAVYLGVESGNETGLSVLNKHVSPEQNFNAIALLKEARLVIAIGFMLFDPSSTFATIRENIAFLRRASGDGAFPLNFCKMLPYAGTPIEEALRKQGRLTGSLTHPDYTFLDSRIEIYISLVQRIFTRRNHDPLGLVNRLTLTQVNEVFNRTLGMCSWQEEDLRSLQMMIAKSNNIALDTLEALIHVVEEGNFGQIVADIAGHEWECEAESIIALDDLLLKNDKDLLKYFGWNLIEREKQLLSQS